MSQRLRSETPRRLPQYVHPPLVAVHLLAHWTAPIGWLARSRRSMSPEMAAAWRRHDAKVGDSDTSDSAQSLRGRYRNVLGDLTVTCGDDTLSCTWDSTGMAVYPRYEALRDAFVSWWRELDACHQAAGIELEAPRWTVRYENRLPEGTVWTSLGTSAWCRWLAAIDRVGGPGELQACQHRWQFGVLNGAAELTVDIHTLGSAADRCFVITLDCTGAVSEAGGLFEGLDLGRQQIVTTFSRMVSPEANDYWGRRS
jgi:hypothetical protein